MGIPKIADYLCVKSLGGSTDIREAMAAWKAFTDAERGEYYRSLWNDHFSLLDETSVRNLSELDRLADEMDELLRMVEIPESSETPLSAHSEWAIRNLLEYSKVLSALAREIAYPNTAKRQTNDTKKKMGVVVDGSYPFEKPSFPLAA
jgi:hypothetical protein